MKWRAHTSYPQAAENHNMNSSWWMWRIRLRIYLEASCHSGLFLYISPRIQSAKNRVHVFLLLLLLFFFIVHSHVTIFLYRPESGKIFSGINKDVQLNAKVCIPLWFLGMLKINGHRGANITDKKIPAGREREINKQSCHWMRKMFLSPRNKHFLYFITDQRYHTVLPRGKKIKRTK